MANIQQTVDNYESLGMSALEKMKRENPKLLAAIAQENLEQTLAASGNNQAMGLGGAEPTVTDRKLGLAGLPGLATREAVTAASPGTQMRGQQMQANQLAQAISKAQKRPAGGIPSTAMMRSGMRRFDEGGNVSAGLPIAVGSGQPIPMLMQKYGSEKVMDFLKQEKRLIEGNVAPERRKDFEMMKANMESLFDPQMIQDIRRTRTGPDEVQLAGGGKIQKFSPGGEIVGYDEQGNPLTRDQLTEEQLRVLQREEERAASGTIVDPATGVPISQAELQVDRNQGLTNPEITEQVRRRNFPNRGEQFIDRTKQIVDAAPFNPAQSVREGFYEVTQDGSLGERFGRGLEKFGEGVVGGLTYGAAPTVAAGEQVLGQAADVGKGFFTTGAVGESVEAAQEAIEERAELTRQRNTLTERLRQINAQLQAPGLEAADIERLQNARNELSQQLENVNNRRTQLVDDSVVAKGLDALPSFDDLRNIQQFIAGTDVGQRLLAENANRQEEREAAEIERRRAGELERLEAGLTPGQKANRALQQGRPQDLFFPRTETSEEQRKGVAAERTPFADRLFNFMSNLGYGSGASKGTVGSTYFQNRLRAESEKADRQQRSDELDKRLAGALDVMREEQDIRGSQAIRAAIAQREADLIDNPTAIRNDPEYIEGAALIEEQLGDSFFTIGDPTEDQREAALAALEERVRNKLVNSYASRLQSTMSGATVDYTEL
jgi:hypothetical protein